ncbi:unnamed protein product [Ectocarpus sp. 4 AP-2014]
MAASASSPNATDALLLEPAGAPFEEGLAPASTSSGDYDRDVSQAAASLLSRRLRRALSRGIDPAARVRSFELRPATSKPGSADTLHLSPPSGFSAGGSNVHSDDDASSQGEEERDWETIVGQDAIKPAMGLTSFHSQKHGFRLWVQPDSVPVGLLHDQQASGPVRVGDLSQTVSLEGGELQGVLEVECLPCERRFDAPLMLDFLVDEDSHGDRIIDSHGRIQYEILIKDSRSERWVRDPETSIPLEIVQDNQGKVYVRAHVRHFSCWGLFKTKPLVFGPEQYHTQIIPWAQRRRHQSLIQNNTPGGVDIHIYAMRMSQWSAALKSVKAGAGVEDFQANFEFTGDVRQNVNPAALVPQMVTIPSGHSHWIEVPRVGAGFRSSRKAVVIIVTESNDENDGTRIRMEAVEHLRSKTMLTVTLRVSEEGEVIGSPVAAESGGILSQVMRVIQNQVNATPNNPPSTAGRTNTATGARAESLFVGSPAMAGV